MTFPRILRLPYTYIHTYLGKTVMYITVLSRFQGYVYSHKVENMFWCSDFCKLSKTA